MKISDYDSIVQWSYHLAKEWVQSNLVPQGVTSSRKFREYIKEKGALPKHFPKAPDKYFQSRNTWKGWDDFLGIDTKRANSTIYDYETASRIATQHGIKNSTQYKKWKDRPDRMPARPDQSYRNRWESWKAFLGKSYQVSENKANSKLTKADVKIIKQQLKMGVPGAALARFFKVSEMQISRIKNGENWRNI
jgi:hypothetical protein